MQNAKSNNNPTPGNSSPSAPLPPWIELPRDLTLNILRRLSQDELLKSVENVCSKWRNVCCEPSLWRVIHLKPCFFSYDKLWHRAVDRSRGDKLWRRAVDRSRGELIDIFIQCYVTDELLRYISDRSRHLKRLTLKSKTSLGYCSSISQHGLVKAIENFPHLEELHLFYMKSDFKVDMEFIGISCPLLKSFSFNKDNFGLQPMVINNSEALLIAKYMPNLCHLSLVGNDLSNEGLQAILDGCPNLQSLHLPRCFNVDLKSDIGRRCLERIKDLGCDLQNDDDDDDDDDSQFDYGNDDVYDYDHDDVYNYDYADVLY